MKNGDSRIPPLGVTISADFFARPSDKVAHDLIGKILWVSGVGGGRLTEVEAYLPQGDPACHAARGRTVRNSAMFGPPGSIYVFRSYGIHMLLNLVCDREGVGSAVLIRSLEPVGRIDYLWRNRYGEHTAEEGIGVLPVRTSKSEKGLACGPGRLGRALGIHVGLNGLLLGDESGLYVTDDGCRSPVAVASRIGISEGQSLPLRYYMENSKYVSRRACPIGGNQG